MEIEDTVCHTGQLASSHGTVTLLQPHPSCDSCRGDQAREGMDQEVKEVAVEEDAASTVFIDSAESLNDAASLNSEAPHAAASSPEVTLGPLKPPLCQGEPAASSSFEPDLNVDPPLQVQPLAYGSFKTGSDSKLSAVDQPGASVAAAAAAAAAAAPVDAISARIVGQSGKFYTIETPAADQQKMTRRYREFAALDEELRPRHPALPTLPEKSVFFRRTFKHGFMDDREHRLGAYLSAVVADPSVVAEPSVQKFLGMAR